MPIHIKIPRPQSGYFKLIYYRLYQQTGFVFSSSSSSLRFLRRIMKNISDNPQRKTAAAASGFSRISSPVLDITGLLIIGLPLSLGLVTGTSFVGSSTGVPGTIVIVPSSLTTKSSHKVLVPFGTTAICEPSSSLITVVSVAVSLTLTEKVVLPATSPFSSVIVTTWKPSLITSTLYAPSFPASALCSYGYEW